METGQLYIVATPIGNLDDMTYRAVETLEKVDLILCEDTRETQNLLNHFDINTKTTSFHQNTRQKKMLDVYKFLQQGKKVALVSDAGTPTISDPGGRLVEYITDRDKNIKVLSIPGPSAVVAALSVAGFPANKFVFLGFPPNSSGREKFFKEAVNYDKTVAFYESKHRIKKTVNNLAEVIGPRRKICICRELTKKFETTYRGEIEQIQEMDIKEKGEFVVVLDYRN